MKEFVKNLIRTFECEELQTELIAVRDVISIVNQVAEKYKGGWIACSVRLPGVKEVKVADTSYMCSEIVWVSLENELMMHAYLEDGRWYSIGGELIKEKVVAWHPAYKPAKYKAEK